MIVNKWPKVFPPLSKREEEISNDFMKHWHETLATKQRYRSIEKFNHCYPTSKSYSFLRTLEIGAGLGEHLQYEQLSTEQLKNYVALEIRNNMAEKIRVRHPEITTLVGDCQQTLPFTPSYFDRILAIHVLEHLPNLPAAIKEMHRLCCKETGRFHIVIPCEGGLAYSAARKISAQRIFERRYKISYKWFIEREHLNNPEEIFAELAPYFIVESKTFYPFKLPSVNLNLCIGATLRPRTF